MCVIDVRERLTLTLDSFAESNGRLKISSPNGVSTMALS